MARGQPFLYMPLTDLGQALRDVGLAYLQGLKSPEELEKERVLALQAQLAIDQARQKIEAERQAQLARQGLADTLGAMALDPTLANILRNAAMMSGDPAITAGFAAMPGAAGGDAAAMAPWFSLYTKRPMRPDDALTVRHQSEIAARDQQNALQRVLTEIAAKAAADERLLRIRAALDEASKTVSLEDLAALVGGVGGQVPPAMVDRAAEGARIPTPLAQTLLGQIGRTEAEATRAGRDVVPVEEAILIRPDLKEELLNSGLKSVSREFLRQATRQDVAALRAKSTVEAAQARALSNVDPVKLNEARQLLRTTLQGIDGRRSKKAQAILQNEVVENEILARAIMRAKQDRLPLPYHLANILKNEVEFHDGWFSDTVSLKEDPYPYEGGVLSQGASQIVPQAAPQGALQTAPQAALQEPAQPAAPGGPASVLASVPTPNIIEAPRTKAELRALPDGTVIRDPSTGLMFQKRGDRFMLFEGAQK